MIAVNTFALALFIVAFIVVFIGSMFVAMSRFSGHGRFDVFAWIATGVFFACFTIIVASIVADDASRRTECETAGGAWVQTGTQPILVGKVIVNNPVYGCVMGQR